MKTVKKSILSIVIAVALVLGNMIFPDMNVLRDEPVKTSAATADYSIVWADDNETDTRVGTYVDEHGDTQSITFTKWTDALAEAQNGSGKTASNSLPSENGNYYLNTNVSLTCSYDSAMRDQVPGWTITTGKSIKLCLNGKNISLTYSGDSSQLSCGIIVDRSTLDIFDTAEGSINANNCSNICGIISVIDNGCLNMFGGTVCGVKFTGDVVCAPIGVFQTDGCFNMYAGSVSGNTSFFGGVYSTGTFNMYDGSISRNTSNGYGDVGGVAVLGGSFNMSGGRITENTGFFGGVDVCGDGVTMTGGEISNNHTSSGELRNVSLKYDSSPFIMTGGIVDGGLYDPNNAYATVTFNKNDGSGTAETQYIKKSTSGVLKTVEVTRAGGTFTGWNSAEGGSGDTYTGGQSVTLTVDLPLYAQWDLEPASAPTINTQPQDVSLEYGYSSGNTLSVSAAAANDTTYDLSYQWFNCDDSSKTNPQAISGATGDSYSIPGGKDGVTEYYYCEVTATRTDNSQTETVSSTVATVTVSARPVVIPSEPDPEPTPVPNPEVNTHKNADGSVTTKTTTRHDNGSVTVEEKTEYPDGSYTLVSETKDKDGKLISRTDETKTISKKGTATVNTKTAYANGSTVEKTVKTTKKGYTESSIISSKVTKKGNTLVQLKNTDSDGYSLSMDFTVKNGVATLTSFETTDGFAVIPDEITVNGVTIPIGVIVKAAFKNNKDIVNATIGKNVTVIASKAFFGAENLSRIFIYGKLEKVGKGAFKGIAEDAVIKIKADKETYKQLVELIKASGVGKKVKFKRIK
ncbi:MAG: InlB B-repeat-containing protein [Lachnospiraceae bacterium]|nr:InlB B-repeat-containing protein [Lachnospiraceae bacterium]